MAKKQTISSDINADPVLNTVPPITKEINDLNADYISNSLDLGGIPKTFENVDQIKNDFISNDQPFENKFSQEEYLQQIAYYAEELLVSLEGIFIGGHAAQIKDQLFVALHNYKNGNQ